MTELMLEQDVAELLHRSRRFVRQLRLNGELSWLPGAGRAPLLITKKSVEEYIERKTSWQEKHYPHDSKRTTEIGTSFIHKEAAHREIAFGQEIYKSRKRGFKVGSNNSRKRV
jgi:Helix-turn-helix domain